MPSAAPRPCRQPGCPALVTARTGLCAEHARAAERRRGTARERGYDRRWQIARATFLGANPLCAEHRRLGQLEDATVVDHIVPHRGDQRLFWDRSNWQSLCVGCHARKTAREDGGFGRAPARSTTTTGSTPRPTPKG